MRAKRMTMAELRARRRWTEAEGQAAVEAYLASGRSVAEFARAHRVKALRIHRWRWRLTGKAAPAAGVWPVEVVRAGEGMAARIELCLRGDRRVLLGGDFDEEALGRLVRLLESLPC